MESSIICDIVYLLQGFSMLWCQILELKSKGAKRMILPEKTNAYVRLWGSSTGCSGVKGTIEYNGNLNIERLLQKVSYIKY